MTHLDTLLALTRDKLPALTVLTGDEPGLYGEMKQQLLTGLAYDPSDLTLSFFDMADAAYGEVAMDLESLPFFADDKVVILDNFLDLTTAKKTYLEEAELKQFEAYLEAPLVTTKLVILAPGKLDGKRRLVKLLKRDALVLEAAPMKEEELRSYFAQRASQAGLVFEPGAFDQLLVKAQYDFAALTKHVAFLADYKEQGSAISQADIAQAIPKSLQDNIFDLTQLVLSGQMTQARDLVQDLRLQGEDEIKLIAIMLGQLRLFLQVKILASRGKNEGQIQADLADYLGRKLNPYQVKFALRDSRPHSLSRLKAALQTLINTDYQIKTGVYDKAYLFELALLKIASSKS